MAKDYKKMRAEVDAANEAIADTIIKVMDGAREAGVNAISLASEPK